MLTRRQVLKAGAFTGAAIVMPWKGLVRDALAQSPLLTKYVDRLPVPPLIAPDPGTQATYTVGMTQFVQKLHRDLPATPLWGYNGIYPGPTFDVQSGQPVVVNWHNNLDSPVTTHLLGPAYDRKLHGADMGEPCARTVVHLHGIKVLPDSDGYPESWFTNGFNIVGPDFQTRVYRYPNDQPATSLWYHDHSLGITRLNVYTGLAGFYFIRDATERQLNLPSGAYEIPLMIQDRLFNPDGSLLYPIDTTGTQEVWIPEFFGDTALVNGKVWPYLDVEPRKYRFRVLNACNSRFLHMKLVESSGKPVPAFNQIGTDGGLLPAPVALADLLMGPAERFDVVIDFTGCEGRTFTLTNDANTPYPGGDPTLITEIMQFRVTKKLQGKDTSSLPAQLAPYRPIEPESAVKERFLMLSEWDRASDGYPVIGELGGSPLNATTSNPTGGARWADPVTETPAVGSTEIWNFVNVTTDAHPIHVHLVQFQVLERRSMAINSYMQTGVVQYAGQPIPPAPNESPAWKDTVVAFPATNRRGNVTGMVTRVIARFDLPKGTPTASGQRFRYVWHCHILEHEDNEMMRPYDVIVP